MAMLNNQRVDINSSVCVRINDFPRSMGEIPSQMALFKKPLGSPPSFAWCAWSPQTPRCMPPVLCRTRRKTYASTGITIHGQTVVKGSAFLVDGAWIYTILVCCRLSLGFGLGNHIFMASNQLKYNNSDCHLVCCIIPSKLSRLSFRTNSATWMCISRTAQNRFRLPGHGATW